MYLFTKQYGDVARYNFLDSIRTTVNNKTSKSVHIYCPAGMSRLPVPHGEVTATITTTKETLLTHIFIFL